MRAMILAAGRGERMRPLTDATPKPLLRVGGKPLIVWHIERLAGAGLTDIIINYAWLGEQVEAALGAGTGLGVRISYSPEPPGALETAGGIARALPFFGDEPFLVINGDVWCDWSPAAAPAIAARLAASGRKAWLLMAPNPPQHPEGDFRLWADGRVSDKAAAEPNASTAGGGEAPSATDERSSVPPALTFSGIGIYSPSLFSGIAPGTRAPLAPLLRQAMAAGQVMGQRHDGAWEDIGTPQRLADLDGRLTAQSKQSR